ncbi:MAG: ketol-acid reductoisomerase [Phycisphaerae bacterium]|nr:ketol-acid reductoisomerase [Phycisphaerae bacterium]
MSVTVYYEDDADPAHLGSRTIAVLGYGSQGQAHAQNLRDAGHRVLVAQRPGGRNHALAREHGFDPVSIAEATHEADLLILALPDESMGDIYQKEIAPHLRKAPAGGAAPSGAGALVRSDVPTRGESPTSGGVQALGFVHGFAIRFGLIVPPANVDVIMIAPKGPGTLVRERYQQGGGITCILAVHQDASGQARDIALAWGLGVGGGKGGMIETTFAAECEADLFGEQTVLCGGVTELMKAAYDVLIQAGFPEEVAYFECVHEVKQVVDLQYAAGLGAMRQAISNTAAYGGLTRGPRLITEETRREMRAILAEVRSGRFAEEWIRECQAGKPRLQSLIQAESSHASESAGMRVRTLAGRAHPGKPSGH